MTPSEYDAASRMFKVDSKLREMRELADLRLMNQAEESARLDASIPDTIENRITAGYEFQIAILLYGLDPNPRRDIWFARGRIYACEDFQKITRSVK